MPPPHAQPLVSVVIPTRDRPELLGQAIASALQQQVAGIEVIVVDDGSNPGVVLTSAQQAAGVRVLTQPQSLGVSLARNRGIAAARGEFVAFLDDDDRWFPEKLERQLRAMREQGRRWSSAGCLEVNASGLVVRSFYAEQLYGAASQIETDNHIGPPSSVIVERTLLQEVGGFSSSLSVMADWDLWIRLVSVAEPAVICEPLVAYLVHPQAMHLRHAGVAIRERKLLARRYGGRTLGGVTYWIWVARSLWPAGQRAAAIAIVVFVAVRFPRTVLQRLRQRTRRGPPLVEAGAPVELAAAPSPLSVVDPTSI